jgi:succinate-acetate transporter protein
MLAWSTRVSIGVMLVFLALEITEIVLAIGSFRLAHGHGAHWVHIGGWCGVVTAAVAWYTSAAGIINGMSPRPVLPVGAPIWRERTTVAPTEAPSARCT